MQTSGAEPATRSRTAYGGTVSLASKACPSVPGPGASSASPGPFIYALLAAESRWTGGIAQGLDRPHFDLTLPQGLPQGRFCTLLSTLQNDENPAICRAFAA